MSGTEEGQPVADAELLAAFESASFARTFAVLVMQAVMLAGACAVMLKVCDAPTARVPLTQFTVFPLTLQPALVVATVVRGAGTVSATTKPVDTPAPLFVTVSV